MNNYKIKKTKNKKETKKKEKSSFFLKIEIN